MQNADSMLVRRLPALRYPNFRRYMVGQTTSIAGTWLQSVALGWLVLRLTNNGASVGLITAAQFAPALLLGAWAGAVADRFDSRRAVLALQVLLGTQACALAILVFTHRAALWSLCALAVVQGVGSAFDPPIRQSLMNELVGDPELPNAIATNSMLVQLGLIFGPTLAAILIPTVGLGWCFVVNASSYAAMFLAIRSLRTADMVKRPRPNSVDSSVRAGFAYLRQRPDMQLLLAVVALGSLVAFRLEVILPLLAKRELRGGSGLFSAMTALRGAGAFVASLYLASRTGAPRIWMMRAAALCLAGSLAAMTIPNRAVVLVALVPAGFGMLMVMVMTLSMTHVLADPEFRGRLVAVWFVVMNGGVVAGALFTGAIAQHLGSRMALATGSVVMVVVSLLLTRRAHLVVVDQMRGAIA
jgi:MFS family permease